MRPTEPCPLCKLPVIEGARASEGGEHVIQFKCMRCGDFHLSTGLMNAKGWIDHTHTEIAKLSGYLRENPGSKITTPEELHRIISLSSPAVYDKARRLLSFLCRTYAKPGSAIRPELYVIRYTKEYATSLKSGLEANIAEAWKSFPREAYRLMGACWAEDEDELRFLLFDCLRDDLGFLSGDEEDWSQGGGYESVNLKITPSGWLEFQEAGLADSNTVFVAMWFSSEVNEVWFKAIEPAVKDAGYKALRIDKHEHNNKIDDEIIASIRGCRFLIADFTGHRGGVYYEAGFAAGLGKPVVWTVRKEDLANLHFDTRQYNHIPWEASALPAFREALANRLKATLGQGPITAE